MVDFCSGLKESREVFIYPDLFVNFKCEKTKPAANFGWENSSISRFQNFSPYRIQTY